MSSNVTDNDSTSDDSLAEIFVDITPRAKPRPEAEERAFAMLETQYAEMINLRRKRTRVASWSIAASLLLAFGFAYNWLGEGPQGISVPVADVARIAGDHVYVNNLLIDGVSVNFASLSSGDTLKTGPDSRVSLTWNSGGSLRIDQDTEVRFDSSEAIFLSNGSIYFDSLPNERLSTEAQAFSVDTVAGRLSHVGTQFEATADGDDVTVSVREGHVLIDGSKFSFLAQPRDRLTINDKGLKSKQLIDSFDPSWRWAEDIAPPFIPAGKTVQEMVIWIGRETGRPIQFMTTKAEASAIGTVLVGLENLNPMQALRTMPFATDLRYEIVDEKIVISLDGAKR